MLIILQLQTLPRIQQELRQSFKCVIISVSRNMLHTQYEQFESQGESNFLGKNNINWRVIIEQLSPLYHCNAT